MFQNIIKHSKFCVTITTIKHITITIIKGVTITTIKGVTITTIMGYYSQNRPGNVGRIIADRFIQVIKAATRDAGFLNILRSDQFYQVLLQTPHRVPPLIPHPRRRYRSNCPHVVGSKATGQSDETGKLWGLGQGGMAVLGVPNPKMGLYVCRAKPLLEDPRKEPDGQK